MSAGTGLRALGRVATFAVAAVAVTAAVAVPAAMASPTTIYNNVPAPKPGNLPSVGFEATSASEFGGQVGFAAGPRTHSKVKIGFSSWGCQSGGWTTNDCSTTPGSTFSEPVTVNAYNVGAGNEPGNLIGTVTHTFNMPYRPSANFTKCTDANAADDAGKWFSKADGKCYNGKLFTKTVSLGSLDLPEHAIISVAYNTTHYGYAPIGEGASCYGTSGGCPYDSLNVAVTDPSSPTPSVGTDPLPDDAYQNSSSGGQYCDGGSGGTGTFRLDSGCWTGYQPVLRVTAR